MCENAAQIRHMPDPKPLRFTRHAEDAIVNTTLIGNRLRGRERTAMVSPDPRRAGVERRFRLIPEFGNRILRVACFEVEDEIRILTVFFDRMPGSRYETDDQI